MVLKTIVEEIFITSLYIRVQYTSSPTLKTIQTLAMFTVKEDIFSVNYVLNSFKTLKTPSKALEEVISTMKKKIKKITVYIYIHVAFTKMLLNGIAYTTVFIVFFNNSQIVKKKRDERYQRDSQTHKSKIN